MLCWSLQGFKCYEFEWIRMWPWTLSIDVIFGNVQKYYEHLPWESLVSSENFDKILRNLSNAWSVLQFTTGNNCTRFLIASNCKCLFRISVCKKNVIILHVDKYMLIFICDSTRTLSLNETLVQIIAKQRIW